MKCQVCNEPATLHVTEIIAGEPEEFHVCKAHLAQLEGARPALQRGSELSPWGGLEEDEEIRKTLAEPLARQKMAAYLLPALCAALLDNNAEVRLHAAFRLRLQGADAESALGALRNALNDPDERVRKVVDAAIKCIESGQGAFGIASLAIGIFLRSV